MFILPKDLWAEVYDLKPSHAGLSVLEQPGIKYHEVNWPHGNTESETQEYYYGTHKFVLEK